MNSFVFRLAVNDFKKKYAGSVLGAVWALIHPLVTVGMYYVVFGRIFPNQRSSGSEIPFVLFLTGGLVPWFYFSEALSGATMSLHEYNYLVKKIVFKVETLPLIKVISAFFVHVFFSVILIILGCVYGHTPTPRLMALPYYMICLVIITLALSYLCSAICAFTKDMAQIVSIALQIGLWATPVMWDINSLSDNGLKRILKWNPLVYVVNGYRNCIYGDGNVFGRAGDALYFWIFTAVLFLIGFMVFRRLEDHYADVL